MVKARSEAKDKTDVRAWLDANGCFWSNVTGGTYSKPGDPDIIACVDGVYLAIESKTPFGSLSEYQKTRRDQILRAGGHWVCARSVDDVRRAVEAIREELHYREARRWNRNQSQRRSRSIGTRGCRSTFRRL